MAASLVAAPPTLPCAPEYWSLCPNSNSACSQHSARAGARYAASARSELRSRRSRCVRRKKIVEEGDVSEAGPTGSGLCIGALHQAPEHADFAIFQPHVVFDLPLADDGLLDAADVYLPGDRGNLDRDLHAHFTVQVHA